MIRFIRWALLVAGLPACLVSPSAAQQSRPNFVLIMIDDFGYGDLSVHGCKDIPTPHIDSIATGGVRCTQGYVSAPQCSPTRAGLLTGRYQQRWGHDHNSAFEGSRLSLDEATIAERLKPAGYKTGLVGKWHLGDDDAHHPLSRGFDEFFGFVGGANPYLPQGPQMAVPRILRGNQPANEKQYLTTAFGREAAAFIDRHKAEPFFLYVAFNASHGPLQAPQEKLERFASIADEKRRIYAAMTSALDDAVGVILAQLKASGIEQNTVVFFVNDNGGPSDVNGSLNTPFRGVKGEVREGGIRIPYFVRWPAKLPAGATYERPVIQLDILPTILAAANVQLPVNAKPLDGIDLVPYFTGAKAGAPHETLFWRFSFPPGQPDRHKWAVRSGDWKLFSDLGNNRRDPTDAAIPEGIKLINLATDIREERDLSADNPDKARELKCPLG
jgi:arylsulfatase A-like enzyme